jgi:hypothetical protein
VQHQPADDATDELVDTRWVFGVRVDERVEGRGDERPVLRTGVLLLSRRVRSLAAGLGVRFGVQVGQMLGAAEQRSERIIDA